VTIDGPCAVRYPRGPGPGVPVNAEMHALPVGRAELRRSGRSGLLLLSFGTMLASALKAAERLDATVVNMRFVKPLDGTLLRELVPQHSAIVTLEENVIAGGAGSAVIEWLDANNLPQPRLLIGMPDRFIGHGSRDECLAEAGLDATTVGSRIERWWQSQGQLLNSGRTAPRMTAVGRSGPSAG
jgi:1-deoxy-D-xylulose-5-phosphate synthase